MHEERPGVIWLTGLSGSGKTTIAQELFRKFQEKKIKCEFLDGDRVRSQIPDIGFTKKDRINHIKSMGFLVSRLEFHGVLVIAAFISPHEESRDFIRKLCKKFFEVYVATPLRVCEDRDVKGLYRKARAGGVDNFTGVSDEYEVPTQPEITIDTSVMNLDECVKNILKGLNP